MMILSFAILWGMTAAMYFVVLPVEIDEAIRMSRKMPTTQLRQLAKADAEGRAGIQCILQTCFTEATLFTRLTFKLFISSRYWLLLFSLKCEIEEC